MSSPRTNSSAPTTDSSFEFGHLADAIIGEARHDPLNNPADDSDEDGRLLVREAAPAPAREPAPAPAADADFNPRAQATPQEKEFTSQEKDAAGALAKKGEDEPGLGDELVPRAAAATDLNPRADADIVPKNATTEEPLNISVYNKSKKVTLAAFFLEGAYAGFSFKWFLPGFDQIAQLNSAVAKVAPVIRYPIDGGITALDFLANVNTIDLEETAVYFGHLFGEGIGVGLGRFAWNCIKRPDIGMLAAASGFSWLIGSYADCEPLRKPIRAFGQNVGEHIAGTIGSTILGGFLDYGMVVSFVALGTYFYVAAFAQGTKKGYDFLINNINNGVNPPQKYLLQHMFNGKFASSTQCMIEAFSALVVLRPISFAFIMKRLLIQQQEAMNTTFSDTTFVALEAAAFMATLIQCVQRYPSTRTKFFGDATKRTDLITPEAQDAAYTLLYRNTGIINNVLKELKRILHPVGIAETGLVAWGAMKVIDKFLPTSALVAGADSIELNQAIKIGAGIVAGALMYFMVFRPSQIDVETRNWAYNHPREISTELARVRGEQLRSLDAIERNEGPYVYDAPGPDRVVAAEEKQPINVTHLAISLALLFALGTTIARGFNNVTTFTDMLSEQEAISSESILYLAIAMAIVTSVNTFDMFNLILPPIVQSNMNTFGSYASSLYKKATSCLARKEEEVDLLDDTIGLRKV